MIEELAGSLADHGERRLRERTADAETADALTPRENQGTDDASNLVLLCGGQHDLHHRGFIHIEGTADAPKFSGLPGPPDSRQHDTHARREVR